MYTYTYTCTLYVTVYIHHIYITIKMTPESASLHLHITKISATPSSHGFLCEKSAWNPHFETSWFLSKLQLLKQIFHCRTIHLSHCWLDIPWYLHIVFDILKNHMPFFPFPLSASYLVVGPPHWKRCLSVGIIIPNGVENFEKIFDTNPICPICSIYYHIYS